MAQTSVFDVCGPRGSQRWVHGQWVAQDGELGRSLGREANTFETPCGAWTAFKLGRYLIKSTGEARYGGWMENLLYNGIGAALPMAFGGKTFYYSDYLLGSDTLIAIA